MVCFSHTNKLGYDTERKEGSMVIETETVDVIHITDQSFVWYYEVKENPDAPDSGIIIKHSEDDKEVARLTIPVEIIPALVDALKKRIG